MSQEVDLVLERHLLRADAIERQAQQVAQLRQHLVGGVDVAVHQRRDRVQRVEEEVRVELPLQRFELRLGEPGLQLRSRELALLRLAMVVERVHEATSAQYVIISQSKFRKNRSRKSSATS